MAERIWIHVGAEKTGTTSLQQWLMRNRRPLFQRHRVLFPQTPGKFNHIALAAYALDDAHGMEELRITCGANAHSSVAAFRDHFAAELEQEITAVPAPRDIVFSNEHCSSRLRTPEEIARLRDLLCRFSDDLRIVLYIREPVEFFASWYSTMIASGGTSDFPASPGPGFLKAADWLNMVQMWADVFGAEALTVRRFDRTLLQGGDLVRDFCPLLNLDPDQFESVPPKNESIGLAPLLFLRRLNQDLPRIKDGAFNKERGNIVAVLRAYPDDRRFTLPPATAQQIRDHFADSYDALKQDHFAETDGPLFPSASADAQPAASDLTEDDIMNIARHLWVNRRTKFT